jgi:hypothetical protein
MQLPQRRGCDRVPVRVYARIGSGQSYVDVMAGVTSDFDNVDDDQASYLITEAVNEFCPALIWQLRNSAAH